MKRCCPQERRTAQQQQTGCSSSTSLRTGALIWTRSCSLSGSGGRHSYVRWLGLGGVLCSQLIHDLAGSGLMQQRNCCGRHPSSTSTSTTQNPKPNHRPPTPQVPSAAACWRCSAGPLKSSASCKRPGWRSCGRAWGSPMTQPTRCTRRGSGSCGAWPSRVGAVRCGVEGCAADVRVGAVGFS